MKKKWLLTLLIVILLWGCSSKSAIRIDQTTGATEFIEEVKKTVRLTGFRYSCPDFMEESPLGASRYRVDNLLIDKGASYDNSPRVILIRSTDQFPKYTIDKFYQHDLSLVKQRIRIYHDGIWSPPGFNDKKISFKSIQFFYRKGKRDIYQRSVYIKDENTNKFYIITLTSPDKELVTSDDNDLFWHSVFVD